MPDLTDKIELASGKFFSLREPRGEDFTLTDVAHGLAMTCRFSGQCSRHYSVAAHAILVSQRLADQGHDYLTQLAGLHHDDAEAFVTDVPRPAKALLPDYKVLEERVLEAVLDGLGLSRLWIIVHHDVVKLADNWTLAQEAHELMPSRGLHWSLGAEWDGELKSLGMTDPITERNRWLRRHYYLMDKLA